MPLAKKPTPQIIVRRHWKACQTPPKVNKEKARQALARELDNGGFSVAESLRSETHRKEIEQHHPGIKWVDALKLRTWRFPSDRKTTGRSVVLRTWSQWAAEKPKKTAPKPPAAASHTGVDWQQAGYAFEQGQQQRVPIPNVKSERSRQAAGCVSQEVKIDEVRPEGCEYTPEYKRLRDWLKHR